MVFLQAWGCISMDYTLGVSLACFYWMSVDYGVLCRSVDAPLPNGVKMVFVILQAFCWQRCHSDFPWSVITAFFAKKHFPFVNTADFRGLYGGNNKVFSWQWPCTGWVNRAFTHQVNRAFTHQVNRAFTRQLHRYRRKIRCHADWKWHLVFRIFAKKYFLFSNIPVMKRHRKSKWQQKAQSAWHVETR